MAIKLIGEGELLYVDNGERVDLSDVTAFSGALMSSWGAVVRQMSVIVAHDPRGWEGVEDRIVPAWRVWCTEVVRQAHAAGLSVKQMADGTCFTQRGINQALSGGVVTCTAAVERDIADSGWPYKVMVSAGVHVPWSQEGLTDGG